MSKSLIIVESPAKAKTLSKFLGRKYKIEASMGHVKDLPKSQLGINVEDGFIPKYITIRGKGPILSKLKKEAAKAETILLATDPDREGEAISWHLADALGVPKDASCRVEFHEITKNAVTESIKHPRKIDTNLVEAQQARRILDRLVGYKLVLFYGEKLNGVLVLVGCNQLQLGLFVTGKGDKRFCSKEYWTIDADLKDKSSDSKLELDSTPKC